jgi:hypothetical protein
MRPIASEQATDMKLNALISSLPLDNPMPFENFLNPVEESRPHATLTDDEIISVTEQIDVEPEEESFEIALPLTAYFPKEDQLKAIGLVAAVLDDIRDLELDQLLAKLRRIQSKIREEMCIEKQQTQDQKLITHYFTK